MAKTLTQWVDIFNAEYISQRAELALPPDDPTNWSRVSRKRLMRNIQCMIAVLMENIYELFMVDVTTKLRELKPHTAKWYANKALAYQHGFDLLPDSDLYDNTGYTDAQIAASKVVKFAAVVEQENAFGRITLRIKLAAEDGDDLKPLTDDQLTGVTEYFARIKDAGVKIQIDSSPADYTKQEWTIYFDPLILDGNGNRLDGTGQDIVKTAIKNYLKNLPFNGIYVVEYHIDAVQLIQGVTIPQVNGCQTKYGSLPYQNVLVKTTPDSGYLRFYNDGDLVIHYEPQAQIK